MQLESLRAENKRLARRLKEMEQQYEGAIKTIIELSQYKNMFEEDKLNNRKTL
jgi:hypothetical protein